MDLEYEWDCITQIDKMDILLGFLPLKKWILESKCDSIPKIIKKKKYLTRIVSTR